MVTLGNPDEGPFVPLHPNSSMGTLSMGGLPPPLDPSEGLRGPAAPVSFPSNKPLDTSPEPFVNINPDLGLRVESSKSSSPLRKSKGGGIPRRYLMDLVQRCGALLAIEEFVQEAVILNIEAQYEEEGLDDGFEVYETLAEEDPVDEEDVLKAKRREAKEIMLVELGEMMKEERPWYQEIEQYCKDGTFPEEAEAEDRRAIRRAALRYTIVGEARSKWDAPQMPI
ncbi:hypothetical protein Taro_053218 [Colocasia esculenta]|uniref:Uncharacterized protein n=1 Tax=Colocasia esculenta TaxID=4460 RepID=A0A843XLY6_COLES|nr:hypothetical protein [Colocasia esculenta]